MSRASCNNKEKSRAVKLKTDDDVDSATLINSICHPNPLKSIPRLSSLFPFPIPLLLPWSAIHANTLAK